ncbi:hypothetical protein BD779DRAFT_1476026 [Infundibulicybe gibba]|nr:hypothetical protein BD779DRAFT_1476026 [Infundibulicybe gibba]
MVNCWIESQPGKAFEVGYSIPAYPETLAGEFGVNGVASGRFIHVSRKPATMTQSEPEGDTLAQPLIFSKVTDYPGTIAVEIWATTDSLFAWDCVLDEQRTKIQERVRKAGTSHQTIVGGELVVAVSSKIFSEIELKHYCLQARGIIPLDPRPAGAGLHKQPAETLEHCTSGDEEETHNEHLRLRQEELQTRKKRLEVQKRELQIHKQEVQIQKEELRIQNEELQIQTEERKIQLDTVKAKAKPQKKKLKLDPRVGNSMAASPPPAHRKISRTCHITTASGQMGWEQLNSRLLKIWSCGCEEEITQFPAGIFSVGQAAVNRSHFRPTLNGIHGKL